MIQVRTKIFETNSSSVHALTICPEDDFDKWKSGIYCWDRWNEEFVRSDSYEVRKEKEKIEEYEEREEEYWDKRYFSYDEFFDSYEDSDLGYYEKYEKHKEIGKEKVVAFGYYGHD